MSGGLPGFLQYLELGAALREFALSTAVQAQEHIKPLHKYFAFRLVLEGGFPPSEVVPTPPLKYTTRGNRALLHVDESAETNTEQIVIGGLKSKQIDVVVIKDRIGPVMAISLKGTGKAFRNLTNRMEEAVGDCTNLHLRYPALVYGFFHVLKANREGQPGIERPDVSICADGSLSAGVVRYMTALQGLNGRSHWRDDPSAYERSAVLIVEPFGERAGGIYPLPDASSPLGAGGFVESLLRSYDLRNPMVADGIPSAKRLYWSPNSPFLETLAQQNGGEIERLLGYQVRLAD